MEHYSTVAHSIAVAHYIAALSNRAHAGSACAAHAPRAPLFSAPVREYLGREFSGEEMGLPLDVPPVQVNQAMS